MEQVQMKKVENLKTHEKNVDYFPEIPRNFDWLKEDIEENGIQTPIILANDGETIIAGHLRVMIAEELEMEEVPAIVKEDLDPDSKRAEELLILDNFARRQIENDMHRARLIRKLKELKGVRRGRNLKQYNNQNMDNNSADSAEFSQNMESPGQEIADQLGISERRMRELDKLNDLIPELQQAVEENKISASAAAHLACLTREEQVEIVTSQEVDGMKTKEAKQLREEKEKYRKQAEELEIRTNKLQKTIEDLRKDNQKGHEQIKKLNDEYQRLQEEKEEIEGKLANIPEEIAQEDPRMAELMEQLSNTKTQLSMVDEELQEKIKQKAELEKEIQEKKWDLKDLEYHISAIYNKKDAEANAQTALNDFLVPVVEGSSEIYYKLREVEDDRYNNVIRTIDFYLQPLLDVYNTLLKERERILENKMKQTSINSSNEKEETQKEEENKVVNMQHQKK